MLPSESAAIEDVSGEVGIAVDKLGRRRAIFIAQFDAVISLNRLCPVSRSYHYRCRRIVSVNAEVLPQSKWVQRCSREPGCLTNFKQNGLARCSAISWR